MSKPFHLIKNFRYAFSGIRSFLMEERSAPILFIIAFGVIVSGFQLGLNRAEWVAILFCIALVISLEMLNTAIEKIVDAISPEHRVWAGKAKDMAAGAVLFASFISAIIGLLVFLPRILHLLG